MSKPQIIQLNLIKSLTFLFVLLGLFFLPFNSYEGIPFLGEFSKDSCFLFFLFAFFLQILTVISLGKIKIPYKHPIFVVLMLVLLWFFLTYLLNIIDINTYYLKQTSGHKRFIRQYVSIIISSLFLFLTYYNVFSHYSVIKLFVLLRKVFLICFIVVCVYTFIEIPIIYLGQTQLQPVLYLFDYFPFCEAWLDYKLGRISSVTYEPPAFAEYLMTIAGWMFSYIITNKGLKSFIPTVLVITFAILSGSRSGLAIILLQFLFFLIYFIKKKKYHKSIIKIALFLIIFIVPFLIYNSKVIYEYAEDKITSFELDNATHSSSNQSRFGMIYTSLKVFSNNPIKGVGFGQVAYEARTQYPSWATKNNWEFEYKYLNDNHKPFPPSYNLYARILAETGIIGFFIFSFFIFLCIYISYKKIFRNRKFTWHYLVLFISFVGFSLNWLQIDTFRTYGFWICLSLLIITTPNLKLKLWKK